MRPDETHLFSKLRFGPSIAAFAGLALCVACGEPATSLSAPGLEHRDRIEFEAPIGFDTPSGVNGLLAMAMAAGDSTLVTSLANGTLAVFELQDDQWIETAVLSLPTENSDDLGYYVATDDQTIMASIGGYPSFGYPPEGLAIFEKRAGEWTLAETFGAVACIAGIDVDGDVAVVGDRCPEPKSLEGTVAVGRAHVFRRDQGRWSEAEELRTSATDTLNRMGTYYWGTPIALDRTTVVLGVPFYSEPDTGIYNSGAAFVFKINPTFSRETRVLKPELPRNGGQFGDSVAVDDDRIAIAAVGENDYKGVVYVHARESVWGRIARLAPENTRGLHGFGWSIALRGSRLLVGTPSERGQQRGVNEFDLIEWDGVPYGAAYLFEEDRVDHRWNEMYYLKDAKPPDWGDGFGASVALTEDHLIVGGTGRSGPGFLQVWELD
jgi:hypothetical protein